MEAHFARLAVLTAICLSFGASYRTQNFIVTADSPTLAREIGDAAERYRSQLAVQWLGRELPPWPQPCPITADVNSRLGAGGATSFMFNAKPRQFQRPSSSGYQPPAQPFGWEMSLQGSRERVLDSVLPHEITHTIFATHFGRPLPRWADEGACTTVEHHSERHKQERLLYKFLTTGRGIAFNRMFAMTEYPNDILPLYSQGYSLARFLIAQGGQRKFVAYVGEGLSTGNWTAATRNHYGFANISELQLTWLDWVRQGSPQVPERGRGDQLAGAAGTAPRQAIRSDAAPKTSVAANSAGSGWYTRQSVRGDGESTFAASADPNTPPSDVWEFAEHRSTALSPPTREATASRLAPVPLPPTSRLASRPQGAENVREAVLEW